MKWRLMNLWLLVSSGKGNKSCMSYIPRDKKMKRLRGDVRSMNLC